MTAAVRNALTFDLEEYFQVANYRTAIPRASWDERERRTPAQVSCLLEILRDARVRSTFFVLGWVAEREPSLVREVRAAGHEIASHGYDHRFVHELGPEGFQEDLRRSKEILERVAGARVEGFRASTFTVTERTPWALRMIAEEGFRYDSSVFPVRHPTYGIPSFPRHPLRLPFGDGLHLVEFPPLTVRILGTNLPAGGGGYFRLLPWRVLDIALRRANRADQPAALYLHPWEFDPEQPRVPGAGGLRSWRHRVGLRRSATKLRRLLGRHAFTTMGEVVTERFPVGIGPGSA